jgi:putrescine transport system substrate-binding protein
MVADALPNAPLNSWRLIFDPAYAAKLTKCGINFLDAPAGVVRLVLKYLGKNPNAPTAQDLADVESVLFVQAEDSPEQSRAIARLWQKFKTAQ